VDGNLDLGTTSTAGTLSATANATVAVPAPALTDSGMVSAGTGADFTSGGSITINNGGTIPVIDFNAAGAVTYSGAGDLDLAGFASGAASSITTTGEITQSAGLGSASTLSLSGTDITLDNAGNALTGELRLTASGDV